MEHSLCLFCVSLGIATRQVLKTNCLRCSIVVGVGNDSIIASNTSYRFPAASCEWCCCSLKYLKGPNKGKASVLSDVK